MSTRYVIRDALGGYYTGAGTGNVEWQGRSVARRFTTRQEAESVILWNRLRWLPCSVEEVKADATATK